MRTAPGEGKGVKTSTVKHGVKKRSPQFSLAKKIGMAFGKAFFRLGKAVASVPLPPIAQLISLYPKAFGLLLKVAAKGGQIFL